MTKLVLVQAGHLQPYEPGTEGQSGAAGELQLNLQHREALCRLLARDPRFKPLAMPSKIPAGTKCDAAVFFHADGSGSKAVSGFSFGYPDYPVNKTLAKMIAAEYVKIPGHPPHHGDNYTVDEHHYYGFGATDTRGPEVLFEVGFVSNPSEKAWLYDHVDQTAAAVYHALLAYFGLALPAPKPIPKPVKTGYLATWTTRDGKTHSQDIRFPKAWALRRNWANIVKSSVQRYG